MSHTVQIIRSQRDLLRGKSTLAARRFSIEVCGKVTWRKLL